MSKPKRTYTGQKFVGVVKWFNDDKGYGFITDSGGEDHFVHWKGIVMNGHRILKEGQDVEFYIEPSDTPGKLHAVGVTAI